MLTRFVRSLPAFVAGVVLLAGCHAAQAPAAPHGEDTCLLASGSADDTVTIGLSGDVRASRAASPRTDAERVLSHLLYETLIAIDCEGRMRPALAASWRREAGGTRWVFALRDGATYSDGITVTARQIEAAWRSSSRGALQMTLDSVMAVGDRELSVTLRSAFSSVPRLFADPRLAVRADRGATGSWPVGTLGYAVQSSTDSETLLVPVGTMGGDDLPALRLAFGPGDLRDLIDANAELVITQERHVIDYATSAGGYRSLSLPWSRSYGLVVDSDSTDLAAWRGTAAALSAGIAQDNVRSPVGGYWWDGPARCAAAASRRTRGAARSDRLVYRGGDSIAKDLAERLVAVGSALSPHAVALRGVRAAGLADAAFERALAAGGDVAYIIELPRNVLDPCAAVLDLTRSVPWIDAEDLGSAMIPLADARFTAIVRDGAGPFVLGWDGLPFFRAAGDRLP